MELTTQEKEKIWTNEGHQLPLEVKSYFLDYPFASAQEMVEKLILLSSEFEHAPIDLNEFKKYFEQTEKNVVLPLFGTAVSCGFPSPADDYIEKHLSLDSKLIPHPTSTFFVQATGDSMKGVISSGDLLVVDRSLTPKNDSIVLAVLDGEFTVKKIEKRGSRIFLVPENILYSEIEIKDETDFKVWGVVTYIIHKSY